MGVDGVVCCFQAAFYIFDRQPAWRSEVAKPKWKNGFSGCLTARIKIKFRARGVDWAAARVAGETNAEPECVAV